MGDAVRALQFEDIVGQLLMCMDRRLHRLQDAMQGLHALAAAPDTRADTLRAQLEGKIADMQQAYSVKVTSPVLQTSMDAGGIELF